MNVLIMTHGDLCFSLLEAYEMIAGKNKKLHAVGLDEDGIDSFSKRANAKLDVLTEQGKVLILTDLKGGTPYNEALRYQLANPNKVDLVSGVNLPMVLEIGIMIDDEDDTNDVSHTIADIGKQGIFVSEIDDDDDFNLEII